MKIAVFAGPLSRLDPEGQLTGIYKHAIAGPVRVGREGLDGDNQADRRVHGGPQKAVHHYAAENYLQLRARFPGAAAGFVPGSLGENISTTGWTEDSVCIGDVYAIGTCRLQLSQPRSPCWKIDHKFDLQNLSRFVAERGIAGWYYRVLEQGVIQAGDDCVLLARNADAVSVRRLWQATVAHRPAMDELMALAATAGLAPGWAEKLVARIEWLRREVERSAGGTSPATPP
jgi:MOSC domain-containing protein YiiM